HAYGRGIRIGCQKFSAALSAKVSKCQQTDRDHRRGADGRRPTGRTPMRRCFALLLAAVAFGTLIYTPASAQEPPALRNASPDEKARLAPIIEAAKREGALTYWDVVIQ